MGRQPIQIEAIIFRLVNGTYEYLMLKRIASRGGFWQPVTGGLEEGETLRDAVVREVQEEIGVQHVKRIIDNVYEYTFEEELTFKEYVFGVEINPETSISLDKNLYKEHEEHTWCSYENAMHLLKWPGNKIGLTNLHNILEGNSF